jgi:hypothetical protein
MRGQSLRRLFLWNSHAVGFYVFSTALTLDVSNATVLSLLTTLYCTDLRLRGVFENKRVALLGQKVFLMVIFRDSYSRHDAWVVSAFDVDPGTAEVSLTLTSYSHFFKPTDA